MHEWAATSSLSPSWNAWTGAGSLSKGLMPEKTTTFLSCFLSDNLRLLTGDPTTNESPLLDYYSYFFLAIRLLENTKRKKQQQTSWLLLLLLQTWHSHKKHELKRILFAVRKMEHPQGE
jgi:hypothetical protein